jgi:alkylation response protein AidB-like acyl-CoA dehydrogenase
MPASDLLQKLESFARTEIYPHPNLLIAEDFPLDIWKKLGDAGLMGLAIDPAFGGLGLGFDDLSRASGAFAKGAACPGMVMSWLGHNLMGRLLIQNIGTDEQKKGWLPRIASGEITVAVAISEPKAGAHPKRLTMTAKLNEGCYVLDGEKAFVTNGPIAGLFVVLAITGVHQGRKEFSAFLVPGGTSGITIRPMDEPKIDFLKPSPHGRITFKSVTIPAENLLGPLGDGFDVVSKRVRHVEDAIGLGSTAGNLEAQLCLLADCLSQDQENDPDILEFFGTMIPRLNGISVLAEAAAQAVVDGHPPTAGGAAGVLMAEAQKAIARVISDKDIKTSDHLDRFNRDIAKSGGIARTARKLQAQKNGATWLTSKRGQTLTS